MSFFEELEELGVNVDEGLERVVDDESLYETMLGMYIEKVNSNPIAMEDFESDSLDELIRRVHILKGLTGNLAMTPLFEGYLLMLDLLRTARPKEAAKEYERILPVQTSIVNCIKRYMNV